MSNVDAMVAWLHEVHTADEKTARAINSASVIVTTGDAPRGIIPPEDAEFLSMIEPADLLTRIDGERELLAAYEQYAEWTAKPGVGDRDLGCLGGLKQAVRALAFGYRHRAGWQEGWAP